MDKYEAIHGKDISSFDFTSTHRLPTVSAAQALDDLKTDTRQFIPTGLGTLDRALAGISSENVDEPQPYKGMQKGQVVEVWGPPGSGKTTFAMQVAANTLREGCGVVWVDTFHPLCHHRFGQLMKSAHSTSEETSDPFNEPGSIANLVHYFTPTLAHLIGLLCKPGPYSVPNGTSLLVIDGLSGLVNHAFPRNTEPRQTQKGPGPAARRLQVLQSLVSALQKLSATRDLVILILSQCATRMQVERGATIIPAINASSWEQGIATRLVLFRDWTITDTGLRDVRLVGVQKSNGQAHPDGIGLVVPFEIGNGGLNELDLQADHPSLALATHPHRPKRRFHETDFVADSEGEDYGWEDEDEAEMPSMPPQWQGSEDLLLGRTEEDDHQAAFMSRPDESHRLAVREISDSEHEEEI